MIANEFNEKNEASEMLQTQKIFNQYNISSKEDLADKIMNDLLKEYHRYNAFSLSEDEEIGLHSNAAGGMMILQLINGLNFDNEEKMKEINQIINETLEKIFKHIEMYGFDFSPIIDKEKTKEIFSKEKYDFHEYYSIEAVTWILSFFTQLRRGIIDKKITVNSVYNEKVIVWIKKLLEYIESASIQVDIYNPDDKKYIKENAAWGYLNKSEEASLYYTSIVIETLSEFDDYIIVSDPDLQEKYKPDEELLEYLGTDRIEKNNKIYLVSKNENESNIICEIFQKKSDFEGAYEGLIQKTSKWVWYSYNEQIYNGDIEVKQNYFNDKVYAMIFILEIMALSYTEEYIDKNQVEEVIEAGMFFIDKRIKEISKNKANKLQLFSYQAEFDEIIDDEELSLKLNRIINKSLLIGPNLRPLRIKLGGLYAFFFTKYPDKKMGLELEKIFVEKSENRFIWDSMEYNLLYSQKVVEALSEFFNYYDAFEKDYIQIYEETQKEKEKLVNRLREEVREEVEENIKKELTIKHKQEIAGIQEKLVSQEQMLLNGKFSIYKDLKDFVNECIEEKMAQKKEANKEENIIEFNKVLEKIDNVYRKETEDIELTTNEKDLGDLLYRLNYSLLYNDISKLSYDQIVAMESEYEKKIPRIYHQLFVYLEKEGASEFTNIIENLKDERIL